MAEFDASLLSMVVNRCNATSVGSQSRSDAIFANQSHGSRVPGGSLRSGDCRIFGAVIGKVPLERQQFAATKLENMADRIINARGRR